MPRAGYGPSFIAILYLSVKYVGNPINQSNTIHALPHVCFTPYFQQATAIRAAEGQITPFERWLRSGTESHACLPPRVALLAQGRWRRPWANRPGFCCAPAHTLYWGGFAHSLYLL